VRECGRQQSTGGKIDDESDAIQARIAALKADRSPNNRVGQQEHSDHEHVVERPSQPKNDQDITSEASVQDRISALRQARVRELSEVQVSDESQPHLSSVQERIQALRQSRGETFAEDLQPSPPPPPPPPQPLPPSVGHGGEDVPVDEFAYPVDTADAIPADQGDYPIYDSLAGVDIADGSNEYDGLSAPVMYPVTDVYPMDDEDGGELAESGAGSEGGIDKNGGITKKRQYQADTAVVALLPSHLQKRRPPAREPNTSKTETSSGSGTVFVGSTHSSDLERFFQEVEN
jgi:hypothetical protein